MRRVLVIVASRANYGRLKSVCQAIRAHPDLELQLVIAASALLDRFGCQEVIRQDGFDVADSVYCVVEGDTPGCMATTTGLFTIQLEGVIRRLSPDFVFVHGDRYELLAAATVAAYANTALCHTEGGEITGTIDERVRHAITKLADVHFPVTELSRRRLLAMGEYPDLVFTVGSTALDALRNLDLAIKEDLCAKYRGPGARIDFGKPFLTVLQHPVTTEYGQGERQMAATIAAVRELARPTLWFWPNVDAGNDHLSGMIRRAREAGELDHVYFAKNMTPEDYARVLAHTACLIGNTSSGIKEGAYLGTPYVCLGTRQMGREHGENVLFVPHGLVAIVAAVTTQLLHGRYPRDLRFGDGTAGARIADILSKVQVREKKLHIGVEA